MKIQTLSVIVGDNSCNAKCPYCISKLTNNFSDSESNKIDTRNFDITCNFAKQSGVTTVLLTGKGEPTLHMQKINTYLDLLYRWNFPFIELQTNGIQLQNVLYRKLFSWYKKGLTTISLSCVHYDEKFNKKIFGKYLHLRDNIKRLHSFGFSVRVNCIGIKHHIDRVSEVISFSKWCKEHNVEQFTWRPVTKVDIKYTKNQDIINTFKWIEENEIEEVFLNDIHNHFDTNCYLLLKLAHGAKVYDCFGQNVSINSCLTHNPNPEDIRQIIFGNDGHLRYSWDKEGAIII